MRRSLLPLLILAVLVQVAHAQVQVGLQIKRHLYMAYEPIVATISVRNLSGRDLPLADQDGQPWFGFQIFRGDGQLVPPLDPDYKLSPMIIPAGQTIKRTVNLNTLYPVYNFGLYRIRANIYFSPLQKFFQSNPATFEVSEGRILWRQMVGVPDGEQGAGGTRKFSVLSFRQSESNYLYIRVENGETGDVYCTFPAGRLITGVQPEIQVDVSNHLHVLQLADAKVYLHTEVGLNGEIIGQESYLAVKTRPGFRRDKVGEITVRGGQLQDSPMAQNSTGAPPEAKPGVPKLSDRPVAIPKE